MDAKEEDAEFTSGSSPDNNLHYIIAQGKHRKEKGEILQGALVDRRGRKIVTFSYTTPEDRNDVRRLDVVLSNDGIIDMIYNVASKYTIVQVDLRGRPLAIPLSSLPAGDFRNIAWSLDRHSRLLFTGFLSATKNTGFTAILSGSFDPVTKKLGALSQTDITERGLPTNISLIKTLNLPDGSRALILEDTSATPQAQTVVYQNRGNNYVVKLDQNNALEWVNLVSKNQKEQDMALAIGTACVADDRGNIHLFFYDDKNNTDVVTASPSPVDGTKNKKSLLACVTITPDGSTKKQMHPQQDPQFIMMLEKSVTAGSNEVYFLAVKPKKTKGSPLTHAEFHLGEVSVGSGAWQALTSASPQN